MNWGMKCETSVLQNIFYNTMLFDKEGAKGRRKHMTHSRTMWQGADCEDSAAFPNKVSSATFFTWSCALINAHCWDDMFFGSFLNLFQISENVQILLLINLIFCPLTAHSDPLFTARISRCSQFAHWQSCVTPDCYTSTPSLLLLMPEAALQKGTDTAKIVN